MATKTYAVHRSMHGDGRDYEPGDTRELEEVDAADLVASGALSLEGEEPIVPEPAVRHTFGTAEATGHVVSTTATTDAKMLAGRKGRAAAQPIVEPEAAAVTTTSGTAAPAA
jgi:hypothetical protein